MSAWRLVVQAMFERGPMTRHAMELAGITGAESALSQASRLGLVSTPGRHSGAFFLPYRLTPLGELVASGRAVMVPRSIGGRVCTRSGRISGTTNKPRATWLMALPKPNEIRLQPRAVYCLCGAQINQTTG